MPTKDITDRQVLEAYQSYDKRSRLGELQVEWPYQILQRLTGMPFKVCYRAMERAYKRGLLEYGVSLRTGWLTDAGQELLKRKMD